MIRDSKPLKAFLSTPSARRATLTIGSEAWLKVVFLSTPSARRATTSRLPQTYTEYIFLSTPSARRATLIVTGC